ncbi:MAG: AraC family transcriptional regulator [Chitinophagaceae bacterium]|nr:MAG: AraC family transcriptional regulator [Chitinophagaceae bacterium]
MGLATRHISAPGLDKAGTFHLVRWAKNSLTSTITVMVYQKFKPAEWLIPFVECYFLWHSSGESVADFIVESPPTGYCSLVVNSGDEYFLQNKKYERLEAPKQFISGQSIYSYRLFLGGRINIAGIVFKPAALATLFNLPTYQYTEERIPLKNVFKAVSVDALAHSLAACTDENEKAKLLEAFLISQFSGKKPEPDVIDKAANLIVEKNGLVDITEVLKDVYMSRRNFERCFFKKVGLSPKYYARMRRMSYILNLIAGKKKVDWATIFSECEFYDHSHFTKDFTEFTGRTPQQYLEQNIELANLIEKPREGDIRY